MNALAVVMFVLLIIGLVVVIPALLFVTVTAWTEMRATLRRSRR